MKIRLYLLAKIAKKSKGFTLLELLIASVMTFFVVSGIGYAVVMMTRDNINSQVSGDLVFNTTRAADFITDEIRQATFLSTNTGAIPTDTSSGVESCAMGSGEEFVIGLAINSSQVNVVYYTKTPPGNPWLGPSSIYRCGPPLSASGQLDTTKRTKSILVDSITTNATARNETCASGTNKFPASPSAGFFACVDNSNPNLVELRLTSRSDKLASDGLGAGRSSESSGSGNFRVATTAFTRAASEVATLNRSSAAGTCTSVTVAVDGRPAVNFSSGMSVVASSSSTLVFSPGIWVKTGNTYTSLPCIITASFS
ncbi:prepilin-type N-terminal cleavage/methylation domain-containing protein [Synechocystis salina LEGE 06099]|uniref:PilW family protein n=1 Tax=Synechocystis salina TaxID=945780 RepID=UPI00188289D6|nr:prepilin-type N-terminal cleavage/methylation domain-containing protein [Synechocystis salina]MBE9203406.1 prepilin-type N-terminal cleavage/methylation domain-containing protein [Synechocystis salina LEGE 06099]